MAKGKVDAIVRWILVMPVAITGYFAAALIIGLLYWWYSKGADDIDAAIAMLILPIARGIIGGYAYLWLGVDVAPGHKKRTATVLLVLLVIFGVALSIGNYIAGEPKRMIEPACTVTGGIICFGRLYLKKFL